VRVFDFGPPVEELKRNCERETGLPAPAWPRFAQRPYSTPSPITKGVLMKLLAARARVFWLTI